jgi:hypothetical protein
MTTDSGAHNPYAAALADLRSKRDAIDNTIRFLEQMSGLASSPSEAGTPYGIFPQVTPDAPSENAAGMFLGMSIVDAAKKLLNLRKRAMSNTEILAELTQGGLVLTGADPLNVVGSVMTRRFNQVGDVVRVARGTWGLKEWYPNRTFKPAGKGNILTLSEETASEVSKAVANLVGENPLSRALAPGYPDQ